MNTSAFPLNRIISILTKRFTGRAYAAHRLSLAARAALLLAVLAYSAAAMALPAERYAANSRLATGRWVRVSVQAEGMQLITKAQLKSMGFTDPAKVRVYGYGGHMLDENLNATLIDDLPMLPAMHTDKGLIFFGTDWISWKTVREKYCYEHTMNRYGEVSYYFLSDVDQSDDTPEVRDCSDVRPGDVVLTFMEHVVHEVDQAAPHNSGSLLLGEDLRGTSRRNFTLQTPDAAVVAEPRLKVGVGAAVAGAIGYVGVTVNNKEFKPKEQWSVAALTDKTVLQYATHNALIDPDAADKGSVDIGLSFSTSGVLKSARLDYIEIEYRRKLALRNGQLHFYTPLNGTTTFTVEGCSSQTVIWDITDPINPVQVRYELSGDKATFTDTGNEQREYIAFNPESVSFAPAAAGVMPNQNIHGMSTPDMVIISPAEYREGAQAVADLHARIDGWTVHVIEPEAIYREFSSGAPDVTAFRKMLKMWYDRAEGRRGEYPGYCLIMGRGSYDNKGLTPSVAQQRWTRVPIYSSYPKSFSEISSYTTDAYIGMLDDTGTSFNKSSATIHVAVGRWPVKDAREANQMALKLINYVENPELGSWRNNVMLIADDQDRGTHLDQSQKVYNGMRGSGNGSSFLYERLYLDSYPMSFTGTGPGYPEAKERMLKMIDSGVSYIGYIGHANPKSWTHEGLLDWNNINSFSNKRLPFLHAATCEFLRWDDDDISGGEIMWLYPDSGVIGMICPSRSVLIGANGIYNEFNSAFVYRRAADGGPMRVGDIYNGGLNSVSNDNKLRYALMADPAMRIVSPTLNAELTTINGLDVNNLREENLPVVEARSRARFEGRVTDAKGELCSDFNGTLQVVLMDSEKVITTYGNGKDGVVTTYNDRKTRLWSGQVEVKEGLWSLQVLMPAEIENNYTTALLSMYAYAPDGLEANGACDRFRVYGYDAAADDDTEGPAITDFYLNSPQFKDGDMVKGRAIMFATLQDGSGINLSEAGIGHRMSVMLDGRTYLDDVVQGYTSDPDDPTRGYVVYALPDVEPGEHSLALTVWDNANNSSSASLSFYVGVGLSTAFQSLTAHGNEGGSIAFEAVIDSPLTTFDCLWEVFDMNGNRLWHTQERTQTDTKCGLAKAWDCTDDSGRRVPRGLYIARLTLTTPEGYSAHESVRIAVSEGLSRKA